MKILTILIISTIALNAQIISDTIQIKDTTKVDLAKKNITNDSINKVIVGDTLKSIIKKAENEIKEITPAESLSLNSAKINADKNNQLLQNNSNEIINNESNDLNNKSATNFTEIEKQNNNDQAVEKIINNGFSDTTNRTTTNKEPTEQKNANSIINESNLDENTQKVSEDKTESTLETVSKIIPDSEVKEKLSDIFSLSKIIWAMIFFIISFYFIKLITKILDKFSEKSTRYRIGLKGIIPIFRIIAWTIVISIIVAVIFAPPIESLVVVTGSLGIAVGLASQDIIKNIFGGIITLFDRPFQVGDKVEIGSYYGEVKSIGLRSTRIVTPDDSVISIPNGDIMTKSVSNANTGEANCQVVAEIYLPAHIDLEKVREIGIRSAQVSKYIYLNKPIAVIFKNEIHYNKSVIKMRLKAYVLDIRYEFNFMSDMTEITIRELIKHGIVTKEEINGITA